MIGYEYLAPWCGHCHHFSPVFESIARVSNV
jgi:thiol-disulfide isomerase/thioredoxin